MGIKYKTSRSECNSKHLRHQIPRYSCKETLWGESCKWLRQQRGERGGGLRDSPFSVYVWPHWVLVAACCLVVTNGADSWPGARASNCGGLSYCRAWAQQLWRAGLAGSRSLAMEVVESLSHKSLWIGTREWRRVKSCDWDVNLAGTASGGSLSQEPESNPVPVSAGMD